MWRADSLEKTLNAGKDWKQEEKGMTEDEMIGWHHWLNEDEFEPTLGDSEGQGGLVCCSPWGHKDWDTTKQLNNKNKEKSCRCLKFISKHRSAQEGHWSRISSRRLSFLEFENHSALCLLPHWAHTWCRNFFLMNEVCKSLLCYPSIVPLSKEALSKHVSNFLCCQKYC